MVGGASLKTIHPLAASFHSAVPTPITMKRYRKITAPSAIQSSINSLTHSSSTSFVAISSLTPSQTSPTTTNPRRESVHPSPSTKARELQSSRHQKSDPNHCISTQNVYGDISAILGQTSAAKVKLRRARTALLLDSSRP